ncbi:hypothetical protein LZ31DRAFT_246115 [Colletotrichum somersetense]|nr:hypothetical protein LZ31DRAFT_246115 [Colletotrichum somersetense]
MAISLGALCFSWSFLGAISREGQKCLVQLKGRMWKGNTTHQQNRSQGPRPDQTRLLGGAARTVEWEGQAGASIDHCGSARNVVFEWGKKDWRDWVLMSRSEEGWGAAAARRCSVSGQLCPEQASNTTLKVDCLLFFARWVNGCRWWTGICSYFSLGGVSPSRF